jgi:hypothetical protein
MHQNINPDLLDELEREFSLAISTVPAWILCEGFDHDFPKVPIYVVPWTPFPDNNFVMYNGTDHSAHWYRTSRIFGHPSTESVRKFDEEGQQTGFKVLDTDCDCRPNVVRAGRFGQWKSGVLTHHAFETAMEAMLEVEERIVGRQS